MESEKRDPEDIPLGSTDSVPQPGEVRYVRSLAIEDDGENPGLYLMLGPGKDDDDEDQIWRVLVLVGDADLNREEHSGEVAKYREGWLRDWTEPFVPGEDA